MGGLFRDEVLQAQRDAALGPARLARWPEFRICAAMAMVCLCAFLAFACFGTALRKVRVTGVLAPVDGTIQLIAPSAGRIAAVQAREGDTVQAQAALFRLDVDRISAHGATAQRSEAALIDQQQLINAELRERDALVADRSQSLTTRIQSVRSELAQMSIERALTAQRLELSQQTLQRFEALLAAGHATAAQTQQKREEGLELHTRAAALARQEIALQRELHAVGEEQQRLTRQAAVDSQPLKRAIAELDLQRVENAAREGLLLRAPVRAMVATVHRPAGASVQLGQPLATLMPLREDGLPSPLQAQLYAPSRLIGFVTPGQAVWLRHAAFPHQRFGLQRGTVERITRTPIPPEALPEGQANHILGSAGSHEPLYRIDVALGAQSLMAYGTAHALKAGMVVEGDIVQDRRALWQWWLDPVLASAGLRWGGR